MAKRNGREVRARIRSTACIITPVVVTLVIVTVWMRVAVV